MTGVPVVDTLVVWAGVLVALVAGGGVAWRATRGFRHAAKSFEEFIDDWRGTPARPGIAERPGVMERLDAIERDSRAVAHEVRPNGGASLRDVVDRVERNQGLGPDAD